jgi:hypothetical protein
MALNGYTINHKYLDEQGRVTPNVEHSESHRPHAELMTAFWLPVSRYDYETKTWFSVSAGKIVALDRNGMLVPAGLKKAFNVATSATVLSYSANDVGVVQNLVTGATVTAAVDYTETQVTGALRERGLIKPTERATDFISKPVGYAPYNYFKAPGLDHYNPRTLFENNFRPQALCAIGCDYVNIYPVLPAVVTTETVVDQTGGAAGLLEDLFDGTNTRNATYAGFFTAEQVAEVTRYSSTVTASSTVVALATINAPVALNTADTPITASVDNCLVREVGSIAAVTAAGDFFVDYEVGMIFIYSADGASIPSPWVAASTTVGYYHYNAVGTNVSTYACATGDLNYGDFLTYDSNSNLIKATLDIGTSEGYDASEALYSADPDYDEAAADAAISLQIEKAVMGYTTGIVGQVIGVVKFGTGRYSKTLLDRVKTAYEGQTTAVMRTPGSATGGRTDQLTYANAAERLVIVNMILR